MTPQPLRIDPLAVFAARCEVHRTGIYGPRGREQWRAGLSPRSESRARDDVGDVAEPT
jgi:hypothetical protein